MQPNLSRLAPALALALLVNLTCNKHAGQPFAVDKELLTESKQFFIDSITTSVNAVNYRASLNRQPLWNEAQFISFQQGRAVVVPMVYVSPILIKANFAGPQFFHIDYLTRLLIYKDSTGRFNCEVITSFPDSNYFEDPTRPFTGMRFVEDWLGHPIKKLLYTPDGKVWRFVPTKTEPTLLAITQTCYSIIGYNYSPQLNETETWTEVIGCTTSFEYSGDDDGLGAAGSNGPGSGGAGGAPLTVLPGNSIIKNIKAYFQCFTNVGGSDHTYTVTVCVDQPEAGTREPWSPNGSGSSGSSGGGNPIYSGHAFILLSETYGNTTITRNVGFYPATDVNPTGTSSQGTLNDDDLHTYNISGSFSINNAQFFNILSYISKGNSPGYLYDLNTNNCTTFAINAVAQAGINLPRTIGTWVDGAGNDPGDLGEDLRNNNIPGMTLNLTPGTAASHLNLGQCN